MGHNHQHKNENDEELAAELLKEIGVPAEPKKDDEMHRLAESGLKQKREFLHPIKQFFMYKMQNCARQDMFVQQCNMRLRFPDMLIHIHILYQEILTKSK